MGNERLKGKFVSAARIENPFKRGASAYDLTFKLAVKGDNEDCKTVSWIPKSNERANLVSGSLYGFTVSEDKSFESGFRIISGRPTQIKDAKRGKYDAPADVGF